MGMTGAHPEHTVKTLKALHLDTTQVKSLMKRGSLIAINALIDIFWSRRRIENSEQYIQHSAHARYVKSKQAAYKKKHRARPGAG